MSAPPHVVVAAACDVPPGTVRTVQVEGRAVVVANVRGTFVAVDATCPHAGGPLGEGDVTGDGQLQCPWHRGTYDLRSGEACGGPARKPLRHYPVTVDGDVVLLTLDTSPTLALSPAGGLDSPDARGRRQSTGPVPTG